MLPFGTLCDDDVCMQLAWMPCELEALVRVAAPFVLATNWQGVGDKEMMLLQVRRPAL